MMTDLIVKDRITYYDYIMKSNKRGYHRGKEDLLDAIEELLDIGPKAQCTFPDGDLKQRLLILWQKDEPIDGFQVGKL